MPEPQPGAVLAAASAGWAAGAATPTDPMAGAACVGATAQTAMTRAKASMSNHLTFEVLDMLISFPERGDCAGAARRPGGFDTFLSMHSAGYGLGSGRPAELSLVLPTQPLELPEEGIGRRRGTLGRHRRRPRAGRSRPGGALAADTAREEALAARRREGVGARLHAPRIAAAAAEAPPPRAELG